MTSLVVLLGSTEVAPGNLPEEHLFKLEEAKLLSVLGMPTSSLAPKQLSRGSNLLTGILCDSQAFDPRGDQHCVDGAENLLYNGWRA